MRDTEAGIASGVKCMEYSGVWEQHVWNDQGKERLNCLQCDSDEELEEPLKDFSVWIMSLILPRGFLIHHS